MTIHLASTEDVYLWLYRRLSKDCGHRHMLVLCIAGWLKRHGITEARTIEIIRRLNPHDLTPAKTMSTIKGVYKALETDKIPGVHKLISVIDGMVIQNEISVSIAEQVKMSLKNISKPDGVTAHD